MSQVEFALDVNKSDRNFNGRVIACFGVNYLIESEQGDHLNCIARQNLGNIVVGDRIVWQTVDNQNGVITALLPRDSILERPNFQGNTKPVAANVDQIFIVNSPVPAMQSQLIDRYLVAVELTGIKAVIVVNKIDLLDQEAFTQLKSALLYYQTIGYDLLFITAKTRKGVKILEQKLG